MRHRRWIAGMGPHHPVISEEGEIPPYEERSRWDRFWLVDPLDGTKEFLHQNGEFTVNIALVVGDAPVLGVVYAPALDLLYSAGRGLGAWKEHPGAAAVRVYSESRAAGTPLVVAESRSHPSTELEAYLKTIAVDRRVQVGSSLKFCWVAEGTADIYPRFGTTMEWDTAAGDCVYRHSGKVGERFSTLRYNTASLRNDHFVVGIQALGCARCTKRRKRGRREGAFMENSWHRGYHRAGVHLHAQLVAVAHGRRAGVRRRRWRCTGSTSGPGTGGGSEDNTPTQLSSGSPGFPAPARARSRIGRLAS